MVFRANVRLAGRLGRGRCADPANEAGTGGLVAHPEGGGLRTQIRARLVALPQGRGAPAYVHTMDEALGRAHLGPRRRFPRCNEGGEEVGGGGAGGGELRFQLVHERRRVSGAEDVFSQSGG